MNNKIKLWLGRGSMLGDIVSALPIARYFKKLYPHSHIIWAMGKKSSQAAMLYLNSPWVDEIFICDGQEGPESPRDLAKMNQCDYKANINPPHPDHRYPQEFNIYSESWRMAGLNVDVWNALTEDEKTPQLFKWWNEEKMPDKTIAIWPVAGYSLEGNRRNPSEKWWNSLVKLLPEYNFIQCGHANDYRVKNDYTMPLYRGETHITQLDVKNCSHHSLFDQVKMSLACNLVLGTDSGSSLIISAYGQKNINMLTDHWGHGNNPEALAPKGKNTHNFWTTGGCDNIKVEEVVAKIKQVI